MSLICDECRSEDVEIEKVHTKPKLMMNEWEKGTMALGLTRHKATCQKCGHSVLSPLWYI